VISQNRGSPCQPLAQSPRSMFGNKKSGDAVYRKALDASWLIRGASWMDSPREISRWDSDLRLSVNLHALELAHKRSHQRAHSLRLIVGS
jgi:hypothetical protein